MTWSITDPTVRRVWHGLLQMHLHSRLNTGSNGLGKDNCKMRWETFKFWDLVHLVLEILLYVKYYWNGRPFLPCVCGMAPLHSGHTALLRSSSWNKQDSTDIISYGIAAMLHECNGCLFNNLFMLTTKKTSMLHISDPLWEETSSDRTCWLLPVWDWFHIGLASVTQV